MTDDAELRARIEAQVAARRAGGSASKPERAPQDDDSREAGTGPRPGPGNQRGPRSLAPTRPWARSSGQTSERAPGAASAGEPKAGSASAALAPIRPWLIDRNDEDSTEAKDEPAAAGQPSEGPLVPVRPWTDRPTASEVAEDLADDGPSGSAPAYPRDTRRRFGRRHETSARAAGERAASEPDVLDAEADAPLEPAAYVPDAAATSAFAEQAAGLSEAPTEAPRRGRRWRGRTDDTNPRRTPRHAAVVGNQDADDPQPVELPAVADARLAEPVEPDTEEFASDVDTASEPLAAIAEVPVVGDAEEYPWQRKEDVDLDLHGAPTWDPSLYPPEPEGSNTGRRRGGRAVRWLFAREPEPEPGPALTELSSDRQLSIPPIAAHLERHSGDVDGAAEATPVETERVETERVETERRGLDEVSANLAPTPASPPLQPGTDLARRLAEADAPAENAAPGSAEPDGGDPHQRRLGRLFRRHRRADDEDDEPYEPYTLPEPDASFEVPWIRPGEVPRPTRQWDKPVEDFAPVIEPAPVEEAEPGVEEAEAAADDEAEPVLISLTKAEPAPTEKGPVDEAAVDESELAPAVEAKVAPTDKAAVDKAAVDEAAVDEAAVDEAEPVLISLTKAEPAPTEKAPLDEAAVEDSPPVSKRPRPRPGPAPRATPDEAPRKSLRDAPIDSLQASGPPTPARPIPSSPVPPAPTPRLDIAGVLGTGAGVGRTPFDGLPATGISGASSFGGGNTGTIGPNYEPDLSRFLEASEPRPGDDDDDDEGLEAAGPSPLRRFFASKWYHRLLRIGVIVAIAAGAAVLLRTFVVQPYYIPSGSMEPTLHGCTGCNDDHVLVDKISYRIHDVRAQDIVVFKRPAVMHTGEKVLIKRVIGLAGDIVQLKNGKVLINRLLLDEPYINKKCGKDPTRPLTGTTRWVIPKGDVFVMGDNRCDSDDSRFFGPIPTSSIVGRAFAIIWPLNRIGGL